MRGLAVALLVTSAAGACDICGTWSGALQPDKIFWKQCNNGTTGTIDGTYPDLAACKAAGGTELQDMKCNQMLGLQSSPSYDDPQMCAQLQSAYGPLCCDGDFTGTLACDVCKDFSDTLQLDKTFHKQCKNGSKEIGGSYPDLAACKASGGTSLTELKCSYILGFLNHPDYEDPQMCTSMRSAYGPICCDGHYMGKLLCDICLPPSGPMCMYKTPSGCPNSEQHSRTSWTPWPEPNMNEAMCGASQAAFGNAECGVTDVEVEWRTPPQTEKKCLTMDKVFHKQCMNGSREIDGSYSDLAACKAAGGTYLQELPCSYMLNFANNPEFANPQKCAEIANPYGSACCTSTCPRTTSTTTTGNITNKSSVGTSSGNTMVTAGMAVALGCVLPQMWS